MASNSSLISATALHQTEKWLPPYVKSSTSAEKQNVDDLLSPSERILKACAEDNDTLFTQTSTSTEKSLLLDDPSKHEMLSVAARSRSFNVLRCLLQSPPLPEMDLVLHRAAFEGGFEVYHKFILAYPDMKNMDLDDTGGSVPRAILENDAMFLHFLLKQGFNAECLQKLKQLPASQNFRDVDQEVVNILSDYGLSLEDTNALPAYPSSSKQETTERRVESAIHRKRPSVIRYILSQHPEFEVTYEIYVRSFSAGKEVFNIFLENQPDLLNRGYTLGHSGHVLGLTILANDIEYTKFLLEKGADPNKSYCFYSSALKTAISVKNPEMIRLLKTYGATMKGDGYYDQKRTIN
jgi:hypothetical protein